MTVEETHRIEKLYSELVPKAKELGADIVFIEWLIYDYLPNHDDRLTDEVALYAVDSYLAHRALSDTEAESIQWLVSEKKRLEAELSK